MVFMFFSLDATSSINSSMPFSQKKIYHHLTRIAPRKSIVVVSRFNGQKQFIRSCLQRIGHSDIKVTTTTGALGTQAVVVSRLPISGILPSKTVLVVSSLVVPSKSDMAARSDIGYTDLWIREYGWRKLETI